MEKGAEKPGIKSTKTTMKLVRVRNGGNIIDYF